MDATNFLAVLEKFAASEHHLKWQYFEAEDHGSVPLLSLYHGLLHVFEGYKLNIGAVRENPPLLDAHFEAVSEKLGISLRPPEGFVNGFGLYLLNEAKETDKAFEFFRLNAANYPESYNVYKSLAEAYEVKGDNQEAIKYYEKALSLNPDVQEVKTNSATCKRA